MNNRSVANRRPRQWLAGLLFACAAPPLAAATLAIPAGELEPPTTARVLAHPGLRLFVAGLDGGGEQVVRIRHGGGEVPARRAEGVRDALVALGLPSARIELMPAAAGADEIILETVSGEKGR
jgi:hypothetical protein